MQAIHFHFALSSGKGTDSCQQFAGGKGLGEVVVRPAVQSVNLVLHFGLGSQEHDRGRIFFPPENLHDLGAAADGKHDVQQDAVVDTGAGVFQTVVTVKNGIHVVFIAFENFRQCIRQLDFVFYYKNFHGEFSFQNTGKHCIKLVRKMRSQIACKAVRRALCSVSLNFQLLL